MYPSLILLPISSFPRQSFWERNIAKIESIIKGIEKESEKETVETKLTPLEKKITYFQEYKASLEIKLSIIKGDK